MQRSYKELSFLKTNPTNLPDFQQGMTNDKSKRNWLEKISLRHALHEKENPVYKYEKKRIGIWREQITAISRRKH